MFRSSSNHSSIGRSHRLTARERRALIALGLLALVALVLWRPIRHQVLTALVLRSDAPSEAVLTEVVEGTSHPARTLERLWRAGSFSGRAFVVSYLQQNQGTDPALVRQMAPVLEEAVWDADLETRDTAVSVLAQQKHPSLRRWLREQLGDADPAVRALAVQQLSRLASSNDVPAVIRLLDDPDPRVVAATGSLLKRVTGQDFGLKTTLALPKFSWTLDAPPDPVAWDVLKRGRDAWRAWWAAHQAEFPADKNPPPPAPHFYPRPTPDFALEDLDGRSLRLTDFRGQAVLLTFWNPTNSLSAVDEPALQTLLKKHAGPLAVLAIAVDPAAWPADSCGDHEGAHGGDHAEGREDAHAHCHAAKPDAAQTKADARALAARWGVNHPVLLDPKAALVARFAVSDLPAYVLIDPQGNLRRRISGPRTAAVFEAMLKEASESDALRLTAARPSH